MRHPYLYVHTFTPLYMTALALFFWGVAAHVLLRKRPLVLSQKWMFGMLCVAFLPTILGAFLPFGPSARGFDLIHWINPVMFLFLLGWFWFAMRGYLVLGAGEDAFRNALKEAASRNGYEVEERLGGILLQPAGISLLITIQAWSGSAAIRSKSRADSGAVRALAAGLKTHFEGYEGKLNYTIPILYGVLGLFMAASAIGIWMIPFPHGR
ncbi:MAG TPA: hypothetical protein VIM58_11935 [Candidatus Methylacidiphilales bacterium]